MVKTWHHETLTIGSSALPLKVSRVYIGGQIKTTMIFNNGTYDLLIGDAGVATSGSAKGLVLGAGKSIAVDGEGTLYGVSATGSDITVFVLQGE